MFSRTGAGGVLFLAGLTFVLLPVSSGAAGFLENRGQVDEAVLFYGPAAGATVYFTAEAVVLDLKEGSWRPDRRGVERFHAERACAVHVLFENATASRIEGRRELPGVTNFLLGDEPTTWRTGVRTFGEIVYRDVWPGIDLVYRFEGGQLEYEAFAEPGADLSQIRFQYEGADRIAAEAPGRFRIETPAGTLTDVRPTDLAIGRIGRAGAGGSAETAELPGTMQWCTYVGGTGEDSYDAIAVDSQSRPVVSGTVSSEDYPASDGAYDTSYNGGWDAVVTKLSAAGDSLVWSTYLGGSDNDWGWYLTLDALDNPVLGGDTRSPDFPTTLGAFDSTLSGGSGPDYDEFVAKLSEDGSSLLFSTFLGGGNEDALFELALDAAQNVVVAGATESNNFPTTLGAYDEDKYPFSQAAHVTKLSADGSSLVWSTFLEGSGDDKAQGLVLDDLENVIVVGQTAESGIPFPTTPGALDEIHNGDFDMFAAKLNISGSGLLWSTFIGGSSADRAMSVARDPEGNLVIGGSTASSANFPVTAGAYDTTHNGGIDAAILELAANGDSLHWATYYGGSDGEPLFADAGHAHVVVDITGSPIFGAFTVSPDLPMAWADALGPFDGTHNGMRDMFFVRLNPSGSSLTWASYCGGSDHDGLLNKGLALDHDGMSIFASAYVFSDDFPTSPGAYQEELLGLADGAVLKFTPPDAVSAPGPDATRRLWLGAARPNPFRGSTTIRYELPRTADVTLSIHDAAGRLVRRLDAGTRDAGPYYRTWNGLDAAGSPVAAGIYWYRLEAGGREEARSVLYLR